MAENSSARARLICPEHIAVAALRIEDCRQIAAQYLISSTQEPYLLEDA
jgi:hypothetical protein